MRANWTAMHDAFQDEIERLSGNGQTQAVQDIAHMLVRYLPASRLDAARAELKRDGYDIPAALVDDEDPEPTVRQTCCVYCGLDIEGFSDQPKAWRDRGGELHCHGLGTARRHEPIEGIAEAFRP